jgi:hypothetical protein
VIRKLKGDGKETYEKGGRKQKYERNRRKEETQNKMKIGNKSLGNAFQATFL